MNRPTPFSYAIVFAALMALLVLTVAAAFVDFDLMLGFHGASLTLALGIAIVKAILIIVIFMHVGISKKFVWAAAAAGFVWLGILLSLTFADYLTRNHPADLNFKGEPRFLASDTR